MAQAPNRVPIHIELLCGGGPSFDSAYSIKSVLDDMEHRREANTGFAITSKIIHVERKDQKGNRGKVEDEEGFVPFSWVKGVVDGIEVTEKFKQPDLQGHVAALVKKFPRGENPPMDSPFGSRLATHGVWVDIQKCLDHDLTVARSKGAIFRVGLCVVPEGPTGIGVAWALMELLPAWQRAKLVRLDQAGIPIPEGMKMFLLEVLPAVPELAGAGKLSLLQGAISRQRLHKFATDASGPDWPFYWFRFDGGKLGVGFSNAEATQIGALTFASLLATKFPN